MLGTPRLHFKLIDSTNEQARRLAEAGAPHGTLVTADAQSAGRGRQGRTWVAPAGRAILCSLVIRAPSRLLPLSAGVAMAELIGPAAKVKWPNDVLVDGRKVAGILVEGRPQERWAALGMGINAALQAEDLPAELRGRAAGLGLSKKELEPMLARLLAALERWIEAPEDAVLAALRARDALYGQSVRWHGGRGEAVGIDRSGRLCVKTSGGVVSLDAGEIHLARG